jgi:probable rRNA maturation factor
MPEDPASEANIPEYNAADGLALSEPCPLWRSALSDVEEISRQSIEAVFDVIERPAVPPEISIVFADNQTVQDLNRDYRDQDKPTNVLSFALAEDDDTPEVPGVLLLGDVILAFETVEAEARAQTKSLASHTSHLIVHGLLHLLGYDHEEDAQANEMESLEKEILGNLGIDDPYQLPDERGAA